MKGFLLRLLNAVRGRLNKRGDPWKIKIPLIRIRW